MTSPWLSVLTSSPGITISFRCRAISTVSRAPAKTLWSVTAIAPSPSASACSTSAFGSIEQSCERCVCMWRSTTIQSRSPRGSPSGCVAFATGRRRPAVVGVHVLEPPRELCRSRSAARRHGPSRPSSRGAPRPRRAAPPRRPRAPAARRGPQDLRSRSRSRLPRAAAGRCRPGPARRWRPRPASTGAPPASRATSSAPGRAPPPGSSGGASAVPCVRARPPSRAASAAGAAPPGRRRSAREPARRRSASASLAGAKTPVSTPSGIVW